MSTTVRVPTVLPAFQPGSIVWWIEYGAAEYPHPTGDERAILRCCSIRYTVLSVDSEPHYSLDGWTSTFAESALFLTLDDAIDAAKQRKSSRNEA